MLDTADPIAALRRLAVADSARTRFYGQQLDEGLEIALRDFTWELPYGDPPTQTIRRATALTGLMAFCWVNPTSRFHRDARLLEHVRARLLEFAATQEDGPLRFRDQIGPESPLNPDVRESHCNSWYLEPLIYAAVWIGDQLSAEEKRRVRAMVRRAADMHAALPIDEMNNRGVIRQAILALAGRYLNDKRLVDLAVRDFHREPIRVFNRRDGQINEGTGPDANYSGTTFAYLYIYRIFSGDASIDADLLDALRWFTWTSDPHGIVTLFGASTRMPFPGDTKITDFLPAFERFAPRVPHFAWLLDNGYLAGKPNLGHPHHCVSPLIWAMLEHEPVEPKRDPDWFRRSRIKNYRPVAGPEFMYTNEGYATLYFVLREDNWHATTTLMGRAPYKGLQHWSYRDERPVIWPTPSHASRTLAWGVDTSLQSASGTKFRDKHWIEGDPCVLIARFENVWHHYLLTPRTLLLLISSPQEPRHDVWVIDKQRCGMPQIEGNALCYPDRRGRLHFTTPPTLRELPNAFHATFDTPGRTRLYAFSDESFRVLDFNPVGDSVRFADGDGTYELEYELRFIDPDDTTPIAGKMPTHTTTVRTIARRV